MNLADRFTVLLRDKMEYVITLLAGDAYMQKWKIFYRGDWVYVYIVCDYIMSHLTSRFTPHGTRECVIM